MSTSPKTQLQGLQLLNVVDKRVDIEVRLETFREFGRRMQ
jgi:hypothetical protein